MFLKIILILEIYTVHFVAGKVKYKRVKRLNNHIDPLKSYEILDVMIVFV